MAHVAVDTNFPDSDQAIRLARRLQERLAWCYVVRLWCWGIDQNREDGTLRLDSKRIAEVCSWRGDPEEFVSALVEVGLLVGHGGDSYYMAGWSRNKEFFNKKNRMKAYRAKKKEQEEAAREASQETPRETSQKTPSRSPPRSPPRSHIKEDQAQPRLNHPKNPESVEPAAPDSPEEPRQVKPKKADLAESGPVVDSIVLRDGTLYEVRQSQVDRWKIAYPSISIPQELRKAGEWCRGVVASRRKKRTGAVAFLTNWLARAQEQAAIDGVNPNAAPAKNQSIGENGSRFETLDDPSTWNGAGRRVTRDENGLAYLPEFDGSRTYL